MLEGKRATAQGRGLASCMRPGHQRTLAAVVEAVHKLDWS